MVLVVIKCPEKSKCLETVMGRNNAALDAITIYKYVQKSFGRPGAPETAGDARWWISWGDRAERQMRGGSVGVHDPSNPGTAPQNRDVSVSKGTGLALTGTAASLPP